MAGTSKSSKGKKTTASRSAKPKAAVHKKAAPARKAVARKAPAKHTAKATTSKSDFTKFSGKFTVRLPKSLHQALVDRAEREGVSLNLFVTNALSRTVAAPGKGKK
jgi:hypothetical protein